VVHYTDITMLARQMMRHQILIDEMQTKLWELTGSRPRLLIREGLRDKKQWVQCLNHGPTHTCMSSAFMVNYRNGLLLEAKWPNKAQCSFRSVAQFSSLQDGIYAARKSPMLSTLSLRIFPNVAFETVPMFVSVTDDGPFSSFQGRSPSASSFNASLLQAIDGVTYLALCPQVVSVSIFSILQIFRGEASYL